MTGKQKKVLVRIILSFIMTVVSQCAEPGGVILIYFTLSPIF